MENKIDIEREIERINQDVDDMESAGLKQIILSFFSGAENEREFILAARAAVKARGYSAVHEYDDGELLLIVRKVSSRISVDEEALMAVANGEVE